MSSFPKSDLTWPVEWVFGYLVCSECAILISPGLLLRPGWMDVSSLLPGAFCLFIAKTIMCSPKCSSINSVWTSLRENRFAKSKWNSHIARNYTSCFEGGLCYSLCRWDSRLGHHFSINIPSEKHRTQQIALSFGMQIAFHVHILYLSACNNITVEQAGKWASLPRCHVSITAEQSQKRKMAPAKRCDETQMLVTALREAGWRCMCFCERKRGPSTPQTMLTSSLPNTTAGLTIFAHK